jgi:Flp pilus assembly protein TadD
MILRRLIIFISLCLIIPIAASGENYEQLISEAQTHLKNEQYTEAIIVLQKAREVATEKINIVKIDNSIGWAYNLIGNSKQAKYHLNRAYEGMRGLNDPALERIIVNNLGILYYTDGDLEKAKEYFQNPASMGGKLSTKYLSMIKAREQRNLINEYIRKGIKQRRLKQFDKAIEAYNSALALSPNDVRALEYKGYAQFRLEKYDESLDTLKRAYEIDPSRINVIINLVKVYCKMNDLDGAKNLMEDAESKVLEEIEVFKRDGELKRVCADKFAQIIEGVAVP